MTQRLRGRYPRTPLGPAGPIGSRIFGAQAGLTVSDRTYFTHVRREIETLLPDRVGRVLDVGCGAGETLRWLKDQRPDIETTGVEYAAHLKERLEANVDHAHIGAIGDVLPNLGVYDTIMCLDVLEHLLDSDAILKGLVDHLSADGCFIISLPNISHLSVSAPLLFGRRFPYADAGILDRTHLRFFVESSIVDFVNAAGLTIDVGRLSGMQGGRARLLNKATGGLFRHHLTKQYVFRANRSNGQQPAIDWRPLT